MVEKTFYIPLEINHAKHHTNFSKIYLPLGALSLSYLLPLLLEKAPLHQSRSFHTSTCDHLYKLLNVYTMYVRHILGYYRLILLITAKDIILNKYVKSYYTRYAMNCLCSFISLFLFLFLRTSLMI